MLYDVAIIGGGVVGSAIGRELSKYLLRTVLIEKDEEVGFGTSKSNSGIIHAGHHSPPNTLKGQLVLEGNQAFKQLSKELAFGYRQVGELVLAQNQEEVKTLELLLQRGRDKGIDDLEIWDRAKLFMEEPNLSRKIVAALYAPSAAVINPYEYVFNSVENARMNGLELFVNHPVRGIDVRDGFLSIKTPHRLIHAKFVINAAGLFSQKIAAMVGADNFSIHPRKGEEYMLDKRMKGVVKRILFPVPSKASKGTLVIPTFDGTLMIGPTAEDILDPEDLSTSWEGAQKVFELAKRMVPSIHPRDTIAEFAGNRSVSNTNDFIIEASAVKGFINVAGIQSPGLTAAPAIARYVVDILKDEGLELIPNPKFNPKIKPIVRFSALPIEQKLKLVQSDPAYGHIVCRCEEVTEREVIEAIDRGARTLDGLKFRVRAGMGRCQGGFCTWKLMELLSERLGIPIQEITKRGGNSWIIMPRKDDLPHLNEHSHDKEGQS